MSKLIIAVFAALSLGTFAQETYVYPYRAEITLREDAILLMKELPDSVVWLLTDYYFHQMVGDERYFYYEDEEITDEAEKRRIRRDAVLKNCELMRDHENQMDLFKDRQVSTRKIKKVFRNNYDMFLHAKLQPQVTPYLDSLPDGHYVQYYKPFPKVFPDGSVTIVRDAVACSFEFRNNKMEGPATWYYPLGEIQAIASYKGGFLDGRITTIEYDDVNWMGLPKWRYRIAAKNNYIIPRYPDSVICEYKGGVKNGAYSVYEHNGMWPRESGFFVQGAPSGTWTKRSYSQSLGEDSTKFTARFTYADSAIVCREPVILRDNISSSYYVSDSKEYYFDRENHASFNFSQLFEPAFPPDSSDNLDLEEEKNLSYEELHQFDGAYFTNDMNREAAIDSFGVYYKFQGPYEVYYTDGTPMYRTRFENGCKGAFDTLYYKSGTPFLLTQYRADSADLTATIYDMHEKVVNRFYFDSTGQYKYSALDLEAPEGTQINGYPFEYDQEMNRFTYEIGKNWQDSLLRDSVLLEMNLNFRDSSVTFARYYFPPEKTLRVNAFTLSGKTLYTTEFVFGEDFEYWNGSGNSTFGEFSQKYTLSATYDANERIFIPWNPSLMNESQPEARIFQPYDDYDINSEVQLLREGIPFSGSFELSFTGSRYKFRSGADAVSVRVPVNRRFQVKLEKQYKRFLKNGKLPENSLLNELSFDIYRNNFYHNRPVSFFFMDFHQFSNLPELESVGLEDRDFYDDPFFGYEKMNPQLITGSYLDGKPTGTWQIRNADDQLLSEINYEKGELNGTTRTWRLQPGYESLNETDYIFDMRVIPDSLPQKDLLFLEQEDQFRNGMLDGTSRSYNWYGKVLKEKHYKNGLEEGDAFERNKYARTAMHFQNGELDGIVQTWFYPLSGDSILLYDLNFQNGALQGESRSYHTNGKLAKRGFFLGGRPIDDYEAYDSLGFKYQYVKFKYTFPVEEKVWELNELSVRYEFDWRDSIYFEPSDITSVESLNGMLAELGMADYYEMYGTPYTGRPRLIDKTGIDYHITKYYPNGQVARDGYISNAHKTGCWKYFDYNGDFLYEIAYKDSIIALNDSIRFRSKGICYRYDASGNLLSSSHVIEKFEKYDCSHTDHYEIRQFYTLYQSPADTVDRMNGPVKNYYDNGVLQSEGMMKNGLPDGVWKFYDPFGNLNQVGTYVLGKRDGRWLGGDLSKTRFLGEICLNPNLPNLEEEIAYREKQLNIVITNYRMGQALNKEFFDVDLNKIIEE